MRTSFFLSRRSNPASGAVSIPYGRHFFISLARSASDVSEHFGIPASRAVEIGRRLQSDLAS